MKWLLVYYQDCALRLNLAPTLEIFKKEAIKDPVKYLIQSACEILQNEQLRMQEGTKEDGPLLIQQLCGKWLCNKILNWFEDTDHLLKWAIALCGIYESSESMSK